MARTGHGSLTRRQFVLQPSHDFYTNGSTSPNLSSQSPHMNALQSRSSRTYMTSSGSSRSNPSSGSLSNFSHASSSSSPGSPEFFPRLKVDAGAEFSHNAKRNVSERPVNSTNFHPNRQNGHNGGNRSLSMDPMARTDDQVLISRKTSTPRHFKSTDNFESLLSPTLTLTEEISFSEHTGMNSKPVELSRDLRLAIKQLQSVPHIWFGDISFGDDDAVEEVEASPPSFSKMTPTGGSFPRNTRGVSKDLSSGSHRDRQSVDGISLVTRVSEGESSYSCGSDAVFYENHYGYTPLRNLQRTENRAKSSSCTKLDRNANNTRLSSTAESFENILENLTKTENMETTTNEAVVHSRISGTSSTVVDTSPSVRDSKMCNECETNIDRHQPEPITEKPQYMETDFNLNIQVKKVRKQALQENLVNISENINNKKPSKPPMKDIFGNYNDFRCDASSPRSESPDSLVERLLEEVGKNDSIVVHNRVVRNSSMDRSNRYRTSSLDSSSLIPNLSSGSGQSKNIVSELKKDSGNVSMRETTVPKFNDTNKLSNQSHPAINNKPVNQNSLINNISEIKYKTGLSGSTKRNSRSRTVERYLPGRTEREKSPEEIFDEIMEAMSPGTPHYDQFSPRKYPTKCFVDSTDKKNRVNDRVNGGDIMDYSMENELLNFYHGKVTVERSEIDQNDKLMKTNNTAESERITNGTTIDFSAQFAQNYNPSPPLGKCEKTNEAHNYPGSTDHPQSATIRHQPTQGCMEDDLFLDMDNEFKDNVLDSKLSESLTNLLEREARVTQVETSTVKRLPARDAIILDSEVVANQRAIKSDVPARKAFWNVMKTRRPETRSNTPQDPPVTAAQPNTKPVIGNEGKSAIPLKSFHDKDSQEHVIKRVEDSKIKEVSSKSTSKLVNKDTRSFTTRSDGIKFTDPVQSFQKSDNLHAIIQSQPAQKLIVNDDQGHQFVSKNNSVNKNLSKNNSNIERPCPNISDTKEKQSPNSTGTPNLKAHPTIPGAVVLSEEVTTQEVLLKIAWPRRPRRSRSCDSSGSRSSRRSESSERPKVKQPYRQLQLQRLIRMSQFDPEVNSNEESKINIDNASGEHIHDADDCSNTSMSSTNTLNSKISNKESVISFGSDQLAAAGDDIGSSSNTNIQVDFVKRSSTNEMEQVSGESAVDVKRNECFKVLRVPVNSVYRVQDLKQVVEAVSQSLVDDSKSLPEDSNVMVTCEAVETKSRAEAEGTSNVTVIRRAILDHNSRSKSPGRVASSNETQKSNLVSEEKDFQSQKIRLAYEKDDTASIESQKSSLACGEEDSISIGSHNSSLAYGEEENFAFIDDLSRAEFERMQGVHRRIPSSNASKVKCASVILEEEIVNE